MVISYKCGWRMYVTKLNQRVSSMSACFAYLFAILEGHQ